MRATLLIMIGISALFSAEVFVDSTTGLTWQDNSDAKEIKREWSGAKEYCKELTLDGKSDWRLPKIKELQSIVDITKVKPVIKSGFKNVASYNYWSSSPVVSHSKLAWYVYFGYGYTSRNGKSGKSYVRCVRGRQ